MFFHLRNTLVELLAWLSSETTVLLSPDPDQELVGYVVLDPRKQAKFLRLLQRYSHPADWVMTTNGPALPYRRACQIITRIERRVEEKSKLRDVRNRLRAVRQAAMEAEALARVAVEPSATSEPGEADSAVDVAEESPLRERCVPWALVDEDTLVSALEGVASRDTGRKQVLKALRARPKRWLPITSDAHIEAARALLTSFPNFEAVIELVVRHLTLRARLRRPLSLPALLLEGPPGIGKTMFVSELAKVLGFYWRAFSFAEVTGGFMLTGSSTQWSGAGHGILAKLVIDTPDEQVPLLLGDEVDKALTANSYPTATSLIGMLEPLTAAHFSDEFIGVPMDIRPLSLIMTCNHLARVRPEILSRVRPVSIPTPTQSQMPAIVRSVDAGVRASLDGIDKLFEPLDEALIQAISALPPRDLGKLLTDGYAAACQAQTSALGMMRLTSQHLDLLKGSTENVSVPTRDPATLDSEQVLLAARLLVWAPSTRH